MNNEEQKTELIDHLKELEDNLTLTIRCTALEEEIQRLNHTLQSAQHANNVSSKKVDDSNSMTDIPCTCCIKALSKVTELQGTVNILTAAMKNAIITRYPSTQQAPTILTDTIRENLTHAYLQLQELLEDNAEVAQEEHSAKQMSIEILTRLAQTNDYTKLLENYKTLVADNIQLVKRVAELECRHRVDVLNEENTGNTQNIIPQTNGINDIDRKLAALTHQIETLTSLNGTLQNELLVKTKTASILQSKLENYTVMQQSYIDAQNKIEEIYQRLLCDNKKDNAERNNNLLVDNIHKKLATIDDQLFELSTIISQDIPAEMQPTLHKQPHSWGITNVLTRCRQLKDTNHKLQRDLEAIKYELLHKTREHQAILDGMEKYIEDLRTQLSEEKPLNIHAAETNQSYSPENIREIGSLRALKNLLEQLDDAEIHTISLSVTFLKQILVDANSKSQLAENLAQIISPLLNTLTTQRLEHLLETLASDPCNYTKTILLTTALTEEADTTITLITEGEYSKLRETVTNILRVLLHYSEVFADKKVEEKHEDELISDEHSHESKNHEADNEIDDEGNGNGENIDIIENKQPQNSVEKKTEILLEETNKVVTSKTESLLLTDENTNCTMNIDKDTSPSKQCSLEPEINNEKNNIITEHNTSNSNRRTKSFKKNAQQKRKISVCLSVTDTSQSSRKSIDTSSDDEFTKVKPSSDRWGVLDGEDAW